MFIFLQNDFGVDLASILEIYVRLKQKKKQFFSFFLNEIVLKQLGMRICRH